MKRGILLLLIFTLLFASFGCKGKEAPEQRQVEKSTGEKPCEISISAEVTHEQITLSDGEARLSFRSDKPSITFDAERTAALLSEAIGKNNIGSFGVNKLEMKFLDGAPARIVWDELCYVNDDGGPRFADPIRRFENPERRQELVLDIGNDLFSALESNTSSLEDYMNRPPRYRAVRIVCEFDDGPREYDLFFKSP